MEVVDRTLKLSEFVGGDEIAAVTSTASVHIHSLDTLSLMYSIGCCLMVFVEAMEFYYSSICA